MSKIIDYYDHVGPGWRDILTQSHLSIEAADPEYRVRQVKEKFGGLRLYLEGAPEVHELAREYEQMSWTTCEQCGTSQDVANKPVKGWYLTLCSACRQAANG